MMQLCLDAPAADLPPLLGARPLRTSRSRPRSSAAAADRPCGAATPSGDQPIDALKDINLTIRAGEMVAIIGPSGSGKSTLMNILGCLDKPTQGKYRVRGPQPYAR